MLFKMDYFFNVPDVYSTVYLKVKGKNELESCDQQVWISASRCICWQQLVERMQAETTDSL